MSDAALRDRVARVVSEEVAPLWKWTETPSRCWTPPTA